MFTITSYTVEAIKDHFGILSGNRYEFMLELEVPEEDELFSEAGNLLRVIYKEEESRTSIVKYEFIESGTNRFLDFELEDDELAMIDAFCKERYTEAEEQ